MSYHGDIRLGDTIHFKFTTVSTAGAPTTLAGTPSISVYPGSSTTQLGPATVASPANGITPVIDFDGVTGMHHVTIEATSGNGYATATNYEVMISAGTVGGQSVAGYIIGSFSIENRSALMPATAGRMLVVDANGLGDANTVKVGPSGAGTAQTAGDIKGTLTSMSGATFDTSTDSLEALRNRGDAAWTTATGFSTLDAAGVRTAVGLASANLDTQLDALPTAVENADALLGRNIAGGSSTGRTVKQALYALRNKWTAAAGTYSVYETDDVTVSWTGSLSSSASADPVTGNDPA